MSKTPRTFEEKLEAFKNATTRSKKYALECSQMALQHFADHGNVHYLQMFHDAMPKNYLRRNAFVKWAVDHAPLVWKESKFRKDLDSTKAVDLAKAFKTPFWDYNPENPITNYTSETVVEAFEKVIKKFDGDKQKPLNAAAQSTFELLRKAVESAIHSAEQSMDSLNDNTDDDQDTGEEPAQSEAA